MADICLYCRLNTGGNHEAWCPLWSNVQIALPEAIRLGAFVSTHQTYNLGMDDHGGSCAVLGALLAVGRIQDVPAEVFSELIQRTKAVPCRCYIDSSFTGWSIRAMVVHLNDIHRWTREQIAQATEQALLQPVFLGQASGHEALQPDVETDRYLPALADETELLRVG